MKCTVRYILGIYGFGSLFGALAVWVKLVVIDGVESNQILSQGYSVSFTFFAIGILIAMPVFLASIDKLGTRKRSD